MISHYLTQIYKQQVLNESVIPDDVKKALVANLDSTNKLFYENASSIFKLYGDDAGEFSSPYYYPSSSSIEYACRYALRWYSNIDVAVQKTFEISMESFKQDDSVYTYTNWWGLGSTVESFVEYCNRFGKKYEVATNFIMQMLQPENIKLLKRKGHWEAATNIIDKYLRGQKTKQIDESLEAMVKHAVTSDEPLDAPTKELMASYYKYYARIMKQPCNWIDALICNHVDEEEAYRLYRLIYWIRNPVASKSTYYFDEFKQQVCTNQHADDVKI